MNPEEPFPPYSYVPGGPWPHPTGAPAGHSAGRHPPQAEPIAPGEGWSRSTGYLRGIALFNAGYYWEAHEVWESLWHAHGRRGPTADLLKALIKLAAAGVKVREGRPAGVATHARRAADLFHTLAARGEGRNLGLDLTHWAAMARELADDPPRDPAPPGTAVSRVFSFRIEPASAAAPQS